MSTVNRGILSVIDEIYEAATDPRKWEKALKSVCVLLQANGGHLGHFDQQKPMFNVSILFLEEEMAWNEALQEKFEKLLPEDPRLNICNKYPGKPISCRLHMTDQELHDSRMYKEVLRFSKAEYSLPKEQNLQYLVTL